MSNKPPRRALSKILAQHSERDLGSKTDLLVRHPAEARGRRGGKGWRADGRRKAQRPTDRRTACLSLPLSLSRARALSRSLLFSLALFSLTLARSQVYTDYLIFMRRLAEEASKVAAQSGSSHVAAEHIDAAAEVSRPSSAGPLGVAVAGEVAGD
jgi:hypothetical protein